MPEPTEAQAYGLRPAVLSASETLAQSISAIAPSTSAALTIPLVYALAGEGTCLAYLIAMLGMVLIALCINVFARASASPGSLYIYAQQALPPAWAILTAWSLCFAYIATASSVIGGFVFFSYAVLGRFGHYLPPPLLALFGAAIAIWIAWRDIQLSARLMLLVETTSVLLIAAILALVLWRHGLYIDAPQLRLHAMSFSAVRLGVVLAIFSFVGFESATTLGAEAANPLKTIPAAVLSSTLLSGLFFVACAYAEVLGFRGLTPSLAESAAPMRTLSTQAGLPLAGPLIDLGVLVSMFAATLAFVIALARLFMLMARNGLLAAALGTTSPRHRSPALGGVIAGTLAVVPTVVLLARGITGAQVYGYMGSLAVFGYLTVYAVIAIAVIRHGRLKRTLTPARLALALAATAVMLAVGLATLFPFPPTPYLYFPLIYLAFLACAFTVHLANSRRPA